MNMLLVCSIPKESSKQLKEECRNSGKTLSQFVRDLIIENLGVKTPLARQKALEKLFVLADSMPHKHSEEKWSRDEMNSRY